MIGKTVSRKSSSKSIAAQIGALTVYVRDCKGDMAKPGEKILFSGSQGFVCEDFESQVQEMVALSEAGAAGKNTNSTIKHYVLSWQEGETPTIEQVKESVKILLKEMKLQNCQVQWGLHADTDNLHLHIVVNRVDPDTEKVLKPAGGFEKEALHRVLAKIEHAHGWKKQVNARYDIDKNGQCVKREKINSDIPEPSSRAKDMEVRTGEKSQERIAIEDALPLINGSKSWADIHAALEKIGMRYERKDGGAVIWTGAEYVKASALCKTRGENGNTFAILQKRFGPYENKGEKNEFYTHEIQDFDSVEFGFGDGMRKLSECNLAADKDGKRAVHASVLQADSRDYRRGSDPLRRQAGFETGRREPLRKSAAWNEFSQSRKSNFAEKKAERAILNAQISASRSTLKATQTAERKEIYSGDWKGKGPALRAMSSVLAAKHAGQKITAQEKIKAARLDLQAKYQPFPTFENWLRANSGDEAAQAWRNKDSEKVNTISGGEYVSAKPKDIRDFESQIAGKWVHYLDSTGEKAFSDLGGRILVLKSDADSTLAALQLASEKWSVPINIEGSAEFKSKVVELAIKHNFKIKNPDLAKLVSAGIEKNKAEQKAKYEQAKKADAVAAAKVPPVPAPAKPVPVPVPTKAAADPVKWTVRSLADAIAAAEQVRLDKTRTAHQAGDKLAAKTKVRQAISDAKARLPKLKTQIAAGKVKKAELEAKLAKLGIFNILEKSKLAASIEVLRSELSAVIKDHNTTLDTSKQPFDEPKYQVQASEYRSIFAQHEAAQLAEYQLREQVKPVAAAEAAAKEQAARQARGRVQTSTTGDGDAERERKG